MGELGGEDGIVTQHDIVVRLDPVGDERRTWAIGRALWRMEHRGRLVDSTFKAVVKGKYLVG